MSFLVKLAQHTYSSLFGTFLCNALSERRRFNVTGKTRSVWDYLDHHHVKFRNFLYENRLSKQNVDPLWPRSEVRDLLLWKDVYVVSELKVGPSVNSQTASSNSTTNNTASASSSGMNSRCEDLSSVDQVDSGANSSKEDEDIKKDDENRNCDPKAEDDKEEEEESGVEDTAAANLEDEENNQDTITNTAEKCDNKDRSTLPGSIAAQYRLGQTKGIESSTDTLVAEVDERNGSNNDSNANTTNQHKVEDQAVVRIETNGHTHASSERSSPNPNPSTDDPAIKLPMSNGCCSTAAAPKKQLSSDIENGCPPPCLMGCDLSLYFKEPIDTDGLTAHHNEVQERLMRIFASHQAEVQALRRDLHCTKLALFRQKSINHGTSRGVVGASNGEDLLLDIDSAARAAIMTVGNNGVGVNCSGSSSTGACSDASSTWETVDEKEANPTLWVPDHAVAACMK